MGASGSSGSAVTAADGSGAPAKNRVAAPESEVILADFSSKIELSLRIEQLKKVGDVFIMIYTKLGQDMHWTELGRTENNLDHTEEVDFKRTFMVEFQAEAQRKLRFEAYRMRDINMLEDLDSQKFLGSVEVLLVEIMVARSRTQSCGWLIKDLLYPLLKMGEPPPGRLMIYAEEDTNAKQSITLKLAAKGLKPTDLWKMRTDAYFVVNRTRIAVDEELGEEQLECEPVFKSEVARKTNNPQWKNAEMSATTMCGSNNDQDIIIELYDWFRVSKPRYAGEAVVSMKDLMKANRESRALVKPICLREGARQFVAAAGAEDSSRVKSKLSSGSGSAAGTKSRVGSKLSTGVSKKRTQAGTKDSRISKSSPKSGGAVSLTASMASAAASNASGFSAFGTPALFGKHVGDLVFEQIGVIRSYTFLDYLRGGMEMKLAVAIDLTRSNVGPDRPESAHHFDARGNDSAYAAAIRAIGTVMSSYDTDGKYPVYGFGAKIPPSRTICSDCFSLTGDFWDPEVEGVEEIIRAYRRSLHVCRLHGPSHIHEVIKLCAEMARPYAEVMTPPINGVDMKYFIFLILTDGVVHQEQRVVDEIIAAQHLPISIIVIGIGDEDFTFLRNLDKDVGALRKQMEEEEAAKKQGAKPLSPRAAAAAAKAAAAKAAAEEAMSGFRGAKKKKEEGPWPTAPPRDIVRFVAFNDYKGRPVDLAAAALQNLPREVVGYYTGKKVKPRNLEKMEDDAGQPLPKQLPSNSAAGSKSRPASKNSRSSTKQSNASGSGSAPGSGPSSRASSTLTTPEQRSERDLKKKLDGLPPFLKEERERLMKAAQKLGYEQFQISRAFREGVPCASVEALVDNIVNGGYGKAPCYREAAEAAVPGPLEHEFLGTLPGVPDSPKLPGQPDHRGRSISTLTAADFDITSGSRNGSRAQSPMPLLELVDGSTISSPSTKERLSTKGGTSSRDTPRTSKGLSRIGSKGRAPTTLSMASMASVESARGRHPSRSILKGFSREGSKEPAIMAAGASHRHKMASKESLASLESAESLRSAAFVRFSHDTPQACGVCFEATVATEFRPCGHRVACAPCAAKLRETSVACPLCQAIVSEVRPLH